MQGLSQRVIAAQRGMPAATLRHNLKVLTQPLGTGRPTGDPGISHPDNPNGSLNQAPHSGILVTHVWIQSRYGHASECMHRMRTDVGTSESETVSPALYVHPGIPDDGEASPVGGEDIAEVHQGIPPRPRPGRQEGDQGPPEGPLNPERAEALTTTRLDGLDMLAWWRSRQHQRLRPEERRERVTEHVSPPWIQAIRRETDITGDSYAAVVNRALRHYFAGQSP